MILEYDWFLNSLLIYFLLYGMSTPYMTYKFKAPMQVVNLTLFFSRFRAFWNRCFVHAKSNIITSLSKITRIYSNMQHDGLNLLSLCFGLWDHIAINIGVARPKINMAIQHEEMFYMKRTSMFGSQEWLACMPPFKDFGHAQVNPLSEI